MSPASCVRKWIVLSGLFFATVTLVFAGTVFNPLGGESAISGPLPGDQTAPSLAISPAGGWVVWQDPFIDGKGFGIGARKLDENLNPVGAALRVNKTIVGDQEKPHVTLLGNGGAAVVFQGGKQGFQNIYARFLNADGSFTTAQDILINPPEGKSANRVTINATMIRNNHARFRAVRIKETFKRHLERTGGAVAATLSDGTVIVAYTSGRKVSATTQVLTEKVKWRGQRGITNTVLTTVPIEMDSMQDIYFQRFTATGEKIGGEILANQFRAFNQRNPAIASRADGTFVLAWASELQRSGADYDAVAQSFIIRGSDTNKALLRQIDIVGRVFSNNGTPVGDEFVVNTAGLPCSSPSVAASAGGGYTITWTQKDSVRENSLDIYARAYSPSGNAVTEGFLVNNRTYGDQFTPQIAAAPGGQLVVWTGLAQDGSREGVFGRWLNDGDITSTEFRVNTTTYLRQFHPAVAADANNRAMVIWSSYQTEAAFDLFGQRYTAQ